METELVYGFALTEGIVLSPDEIDSVEDLGDGDRFRLVPQASVQIDPEQFRRNTYTTSSCGVCGKASIDAVRISARQLPPGPKVSTSLVAELPARLRSSQEVFEVTGGLHGAGIFDSSGNLLAIAEDVGRHNAVDKAIGSLARRQWPIGEVVLVVSGRISFEIAQKAGVVGIPIVAGVSAATTLATDLATELAMTLCGFVRDDSLVVYNDAGRLAD
jgi:FdhD protein